MSFPPLATAPATPLPLDELSPMVLPRTVSPMVGEGRARDAVQRGVLRPADIGKAEMSAVESIWLPLWRIDGSVDAFSVGLTSYTRTRRTGPDVGVLGGGGPTPPRAPKRRVRHTHGVMPSGGYRHRDAVVPVLARRTYFINPSARVKLPVASLVPMAEADFEGAPLVLPDLESQAAEDAARIVLSRKGQPGGSNTLFAKVDVTLRDTRLCFYPLYVVRYRYGGDAVDGGPRTFFAAISGTTGKVVASEHPGVLKSVGSKLKSLFGG